MFTSEKQAVAEGEKAGACRDFEHALRPNPDGRRQTNLDWGQPRTPFWRKMSEKE